MKRVLEVLSVVAFVLGFWAAVAVGVAQIWQTIGPLPFLIGIGLALAISSAVLGVLLKRELQQRVRFWQVRGEARRHVVLRFRQREQEQREWRSSWSPSGDY
jgi:hypothetical protein